MKKVLGVLLALLVLASFAGTLVFLWRKAEKPPVVHETEAPFITDIVRKTVATGSVVPRKEVEIKPQVSGILEEVLVAPGQAVQRGDTVARVRIVPDMVSLADASNRVNRARIALAEARRDQGRSSSLLGQGTISQALHQESRTALDQAVEELTAAEDNLDLIREGSTAKTGATSNTLVRSTLTGMVLEVPVEVGDSVILTNNFNAGTTIASVADMEDLVFKGKIDEAEVGKLRPGMDLQISIGAIEGQSFEASLEHVAPKGFEENGAVQFEIRASVKLRDDLFVRANYSANADIVLDRRQGVLAVNEGLLVFEGDAPFVEVEIAPQTFERRPLEVGLSDGINIEVLSGVKAGDRIKKPAALVN